MENNRACQSHAALPTPAAGVGEMLEGLPAGRTAMKGEADCLLGISEASLLTFQGSRIFTSPTSFLSPPLREAAASRVSGRGPCRAWSDTST